MSDLAWIALSLTGRIGGKTLRALLQHFDGDVQAVLRADTPQLREVPGIGPKIAQSIRQLDLAQVEQALYRWQAQAVRIVTLDDPAYPDRLRALPDAPPTLFMRGEWRADPARTVALVGTRSPTAETRKIAQNLSSLLVERGYTIISGLALGIDAAAHMGALALPQGYTLAVLGCGVLNIYPPAHQPLAEAVMRRGALLAEVNPDAPPSSSALVARNRLISGLSDALIVVETTTEGGAMHAARFAQAQGRAVYALDIAASGNQAILAQGGLPIAPDLQAVLL
ncbi:MAG: DNA-processing protein DprA [Anaerolineae bacterium]|nr:DNA-processing protein DprA [Anaerolineae bacterium]